MSGPRLVKVHGAGGWWTTGSLVEAGGLAVTRCGHWRLADGRGPSPSGWNVTHLPTGLLINPPTDSECTCLPLPLVRRWHALLVPLADWEAIGAKGAPLARKVRDAFRQATQEVAP